MKQVPPRGSVGPQCLTARAPQGAILRSAYTPRPPRKPGARRASPELPHSPQPHTVLTDPPRPGFPACQRPCPRARACSPRTSTARLRRDSTSWFDFRQGCRCRACPDLSQSTSQPVESKLSTSTHTIHTCTHISHMHTCVTNVLTRVCSHTTHMCTPCVHTCLHVCARVHMHAHMHTCAHLCMHTCLRTHAHTHTR